MYRIRRFGIIKTATVAAIMYVIVIAIFFVPATLIFGIAGTTGGAGNVGAGVGGLIIAGVIAALLYGFFGFIFTAVACAVYNLAAGWVGGIEVQVEGVMTPPPPPAWGPITPGAPTASSTTDTAPYDPRSAPRDD